MVTITSEQSAPFFRLPTELRLRIYELVLCHKVIHITIRQAYQTDKHLFDQFFAYNDNSGFSQADGSIQLRNHWTFMHTVCQAPEAEEQAYQQTKTASSDEPPLHYWDRHTGCRRVQNHFVHFQYPYLREQCRFSLGGNHSRCKHFQDDVARYGQPRQGGLELAFPDSRLDMNLLRTCRHIYQETALLPYAENTFAVDAMFDRSLAFYEYVLKSHQREAINTVHALQWMWDDLQRARDVLPGLECMIWPGGVENIMQKRTAADWKTLRAELQQTTHTRPLIRDARVIVTGSHKEKWTKQERRALAEDVEKALTDPLLPID